MKENQKGQSIQNNPGGQQKQFDQNRKDPSQDHPKNIDQKEKQNELEIEQPNRKEREKDPMKKPYMGENEEEEQDERDENVDGGEQFKNQNPSRNREEESYRKTDAQWKNEETSQKQNNPVSEDFNDTRKQTLRDEEEEDITNEDEQNDITNKGGQNRPMR